MVAPGMAKRKKQKKRAPVADAPTGGAMAAGLSGLGFQSRGPSPEGAAPNATTAPALDLSAKLVVRREKKGRGGRTVTVLFGVQGDLPAFAKTLRKALGCGASVDGETIVLQGDLTSRTRDHLTGLGAKRVVIGN
jgi:translation initiation factor 1